MVRAALYVDFDNFIGALLKLDPDGGLRLGREPQLWVDALATDHLVRDERDWLVRRCYINPAGAVKATPGQPGLALASFRPYLTRAGFEVIDCPSLTQQHKSAADIRLVLDVVDAVRADPHYEEFVLVSSDADFTPLVHRLRAAGRLVTVVSAGLAAPAYLATAHRVVEAPALLALASSDTATPSGQTPGDAQEAPDAQAVEESVAFAELVRTRYAAATGPLNLSYEAALARASLGEVISQSGWFGAGSFKAAVERLGLTGELTIDQHRFWDATRHTPPAPEPTLGEPGSPEPELPAVTDFDVTLPDPLPALRTVIGVPRLDRHTWSRLFATLAEYAATQPFNLTEATRWTRDRLGAAGTPVGRQSVSFVVVGAQWGGAPLHADPPPDAEEIRTAFLTSVFERAVVADLQLDDTAKQVVTDWITTEA